MTTSALEQIKAHSKYEPSQTVWYKKFTYRVTVTGYWEAMDTKKGLSQYEEDFHKNIVLLHNNAKAFLKANSVEFKTRSEYSYNFYLKTPDDVLGLINSIDSKHIKLINGPSSEKMNNVLQSDIDSVFRKDLIYKKYRYRVDVVVYRNENELHILQEIKNFIIENFENNTYKISSNFSDYDHYNKLYNISSTTAQLNSWAASRQMRIPWRLTGSFYTNSYEDVCTLHMMYKTYIKKTVKVTLLSEVE